MKEELDKDTRARVEEIVQEIEKQGGTIEEVWSEGDFTASRVEIVFRI